MLNEIRLADRRQMDMAKSRQCEVENELHSVQQAIESAATRRARLEMEISRCGLWLCEC